MKPARLLLALFLFLVAGLFGCSGNSSSGSTPPPVTNGQLYALNGVTGTVLHFSAGGSGNIAPAASIHGPATQLSSPDFALAHGANDRLFVSDAGSSVLIFERARTKNGNVAPDRTIAGAATQLGYRARPAIHLRRFRQHDPGLCPCLHRERQRGPHTRSESRIPARTHHS